MIRPDMRTPFPDDSGFQEGEKSGEDRISCNIYLLYFWDSYATIILRI